MKKLFLILSLISSLCFGQQNLNNNTVQIDAAGTISNIAGVKSHVRDVSTSQTLLKTDCFVRASGNITLTMPTVTVADSGLRVTIKNVGTYTDEVVLSAGSNYADSLTTGYLSRWQTMTFIVNKQGHLDTWEKNSRTDLIYDVSASGSFRSIHEVLAYLKLHMRGPSVVRLGGGDYHIDQSEYINLSYPITFRGFSFATTKIYISDVLANKTAIRSNSDLTLENMQVIAKDPTIDFIHYVGKGTYNEIRNFSCNGASIAILDSANAELWITETDIENSASAGIKIHSADDSVKLRITTTDFINCKRGIWLAKGNYPYIDINGGCSFRCSAGDTGLVYVPATFTNLVNGYITGTKWNNIGTYNKGWDFTRTDARDANWYIQSNAGATDRNPRCKINAVSSTDTTAIASANGWVKAKFTNSATSSTTKWTLTNNRAVYQPKNIRDAIGTVSLSVSAASNTRTVHIAIVKNGIKTTRYGQMSVFCKTLNEPMPITTSFEIPNIGNGDYLEVWATCDSPETLTISSVSWSVDTK